MSDLPTPERMQLLCDQLRAFAFKDRPEGLVDEIIDTICARASGRLVDREAVDYEAAYDRFDAILARPEPVTADTIMGNLNSIVDAALGVTE